MQETACSSASWNGASSPPPAADPPGPPGVVAGSGALPAVQLPEESAPASGHTPPSASS